MRSSVLGRRPQLAILLVLISLVMAGNGIVAPVLPLYAMEFGVGGALVGMLITLFGVGRLIANVPAGILSEKFGRRPFLSAGPALIAVGAVGAAMSDTFEMLLFWRLVQGIGSGIYMTTSAAVLVQLSTPGKRGYVMALYQGFLLLGAGVGPALGGFLAARFGSAAPFWGYAVVATAALVLVLTAFREPAEPEPNEADESGPPITMRAFLRNRAYVLLCAVTFWIFFTRTAAQWLAIPLVGNQRFGLSVDLIGLALTASAVANAAMLPLVGPATTRFGAVTVAALSTSVVATALLIVAFSDQDVFYWTALVMMGIGSGFNGPSVAAAIADITPSNLFGPAMGTQRAIADAGFVIGPILVGLVHDLTTFGYSGALAGNAVMLAMSGMLLWIGVGAAQRSRRTRHEEAA
ncbi:hypothetical protein DLJ53_28570 [Acuticoccus sediminis]|uniref:Major facilitator superfamily (MFS) profile domain-containing protein n=1 Tax=Acuticoccus sediminis TaxID=2184697 RepID=A0A8B2NIC9_9HYPH|nr:hypothetical protein DLJ53_28570 [Acuticoccus sediminis]